MQAKGPINDRLRRALPMFTGDGSLDVSDWLSDLERRSKAELVRPEEVIDFLLESNTARLFRALWVSEASHEEVVKRTLLAQYGISRQEPFRRFSDHQLLVDESVDDLQRLGTRMEAKTSDMIFRVKFIEGLPPSIHNWSVMLPDVYTSDFDTLMPKVRDRMSAQKAASGKLRAATASVKKQGLTYPRCTGSQRVRDFPHWPSSCGKSSVWFCCKRRGCFAWDCPLKHSWPVSLSRKDSVAWGNLLSPGYLVVIGISAPVTSIPGVLVVAGRLSSREMPVITTMVNGRSVSCLVDSGNGCTMVSTRVVVGTLGRKARPVATDDGRTSSSGRGCWASVELQGHSF